MTTRDAALVLADGSVFEGEAIGAEAAVASGEVVFNTVLSGYQEVITDPSYAGQMIAFTNPHIGNYGVNPADDEAVKPYARGVIVRELARRHSNHRADRFAGRLPAPLRRAGHRRHRHPPPHPPDPRDRRPARSVRHGASETELLAAAQAEPGTDGVDLVAQVTTAEPYTAGNGPLSIVAYDFGIKRTIVELPGRDRHRRGRARRRPPRPRCWPATPTACSSRTGPATRRWCRTRRTRSVELVGKVPVFGICLGPPAARPRPRRAHVQAAVRPPRRQPPDPAPAVRRHRDHQPEPQLLRRPGQPRRHRCRDPPQPQRRHERRHPRARARRRSACSTTRRPGPGPHDSRDLFREFESMMKAGV